MSSEETLQEKETGAETGPESRVPLWRRAVRAGQSFVDAWSKDNAALLAAGVTFYATFSLAPLLALILFVSSLFLGEGAARAQLVESVGGFTTPRTAAAIERLAETLEDDASTGLTALTAILLLFGASALFRHLRTALDLILDVPPSESRGWVQFIVSRAVAVAMVVAVILVLLATIVLTSMLGVVRQFVPELAMGDLLLWRTVDIAVSTAVVFLVFGATLKYVPDVTLKWKHVALGAAVAAVLFSAARLGLSIYLSRADMASSYGAAASLAVVLIAVYVAVLVLFIGAEVTQLVARRDAEFRLERDRKRRENGHSPRK
jgi:membrane protein